MYPVASGYDLGADMAMLASNESCFAPLPEVVEARAARAHRRQPLPGPVVRAAAPRAVRPLRDPAGADRAGQRLLRHPAGRRRGAARARAEVVYAWPAFSVYPHLAAASGARAIEVPLDDDDRHDLDAIAAEITVATRLVLICNPNNPTSTVVGLDAIEAFLRRVPATCA